MNIKEILHKINECGKSRIIDGKGTVYPEIRVISLVERGSTRIIHSIAQGKLQMFCTPKGNPTAFLKRFIKNGIEEVSIIEIESVL